MQNWVKMHHCIVPKFDSSNLRCIFLSDFECVLTDYELILVSKKRIGMENRSLMDFSALVKYKSCTRVLSKITVSINIWKLNSELMYHLHWRHLLAIMPATAMSIFTCLGHLGWCNIDRIISIFCSAAWKKLL